MTDSTDSNFANVANDAEYTGKRLAFRLALLTEESAQQLIDSLLSTTAFTCASGFLPSDLARFVYLGKDGEKSINIAAVIGHILQRLVASDSTESLVIRQCLNDTLDEFDASDYLSADMYNALQSPTGNAADLESEVNTLLDEYAAANAASDAEESEDAEESNDSQDSSETLDDADDFVKRALVALFGNGAPDSATVTKVQVDLKAIRLNQEREAIEEHIAACEKSAADAPTGSNEQLTHRAKATSMQAYLVALKQQIANRTK